MTNVAELVPIKVTEKGNLVVNGRNLHVFLEPKRKAFSTWIKEMISKYGFIEDVDFCKLYYDIKGLQIAKALIESGQRAFKIEYVLLLEMAKKIVIEEKLEKGDLVLQYFLNSVGYNSSANTNKTKVVAKDTITSLELVDQINLFRREEGKVTMLAHSDLLKVIRDEFEEELQAGKISCLLKTRDLPNGGKRDYPYYLLTLSQAKQVLLRESKFVRKHVIAYIDKLENAIKNNISDKDRMLLAIMKSESEEEMAENVAKYERNYVKPLERRVDETEKKVEHQVGVISGLTSKIKLQTQRQFLNEIIRMRGNEDGLISARWNMLYKFYENQKHINLSIRMKAYNSTNKPKITSRLDYVDTVINDLGTLYEVAVKTFESDFKSKLQKYLDAL